MGDLKEHAINVFVVDRNGKPIPDALVQILDNEEPVAEATTKGYSNAPVRFQVSAQYESVKLRAKVARYVMVATVDVNEGNYTFKFEKIALPKSNAGSSSMKAAWIFGSILLLFLISLVFWNPSTLPPTSQKVIRLLSSVFGGLISGFFAGNLNLAGRIPKLNNITIGAVGGFAVFVLIFLTW